MMHMTFYWGRKVTLLVDSWKTDSWTSYGLSLVACLLISVFYQYMEDRRLRFKLLSSRLKNKNNNKNNPPSDDDDDDDDEEINSNNNNNTPLLISRSNKLTNTNTNTNINRFAGAVVFGVNSAIGYLLMLAVMSFNGGVFVAVVVGLALGFLLFRSGDDHHHLLLLDNPCACA